ncbi:ATP cone domain-containing protein [Daejeonella rubra]|uniref:ATP cone domain-containing protein n=1 Tax=Daejeonella rubra TaxID=990371 RepID=A0A1G9YKK2_9SPHI|nr:ATP cone domain-containing protein [Daejeonella rubra]SDN09769.1 ATP cone domain-containing protein [Daejeonella rubra]
MTNKVIRVTKMSGDQVLFDEEKLKRSLRRSRADETIINEVIAKVKTQLYDSMPTKAIYKLAFSYLKKHSSFSASRYKLKSAILELGPSGFPFEKYIAELLKFKNYTTEVGTIVQGHCVSHEIDIIAEKEGRHLIIECKFHSDQRRFCDIKVPLYIHSRFKDVETRLKEKHVQGGKTYLGGLVTNTRFSSDALQYGNCMGMFMLSWDYPLNKSLKMLIDQSGLHPITSLLTMTKLEKDQLLADGIVLCRDLVTKEKKLHDINISEIRIRKIMEEVKSICESRDD